MSFNSLGLRPEMLTGIKAQGYTEPTPIQIKAIPVILEGKDILAGAQTGTGKTAAFTLPVLDILSREKSNSRRPRALVLAPTRELAAQVGESIKVYGQSIRLRSTVIFGGVGINPQIQRLRRGVDIVVGTPGRLLDLAGQRELDLSQIEILILDEADRMLDMGFIHDIKKIIRLVPQKRQTLFFSATYSKEIKTLADKILHQPVHVEVARQNTTAETVSQSIYHVSKTKKRALLSHLINSGSWEQVLIFTKTKHGANRLAKQLTMDGIDATAIHGNKSQSARTRALADFKSNQVRALVATDIAARGLDIDKLPHVVNYELPHVSEDYVHRIGRTGRAGTSGEAVSLVTGEEVKLLRSIERLIKNKITVKYEPGYSEKEALTAEPESKPSNNRPRQSYGRDSRYNSKSGQGRRPRNNNDSRNSNDSRGSSDSRNSNSSRNSNDSRNNSSKYNSYRSS